MGYEIDDIPASVKNQISNISIKFSPVDIDIELITKFEIGKSFDEAFKVSIEVEINKGRLL